MIGWGSKRTENGEPAKLNKTHAHPRHAGIPTSGPQQQLSQTAGIFLLDWLIMRTVYQSTFSLQTSSWLSDSIWILSTITSSSSPSSIVWVLPRRDNVPLGRRRFYASINQYHIAQPTISTRVHLLVHISATLSLVRSLVLECTAYFQYVVSPTLTPASR